MTKFEDLFVTHRGRYSSKWQHYFEIYDRHLFKFIGQSFTFIEIGIDQGGSLELWKKYFGKKVNLVGIDIKNSVVFDDDQIRTFQGDQKDTEFLSKVLEKIDTPTVILDDGSHIQSDILTTFDFMFPHLSDSGVYIIEDCHTAYWPRFQGGITSHLNIVDIFSRTVHDVNSKYYNEPKTVKIQQLDSIHFYDSVIVLEKRQKLYNRYMVDVDNFGPRIRDTI